MILCGLKGVLIVSIILFLSTVEISDKAISLTLLGSLFLKENTLQFNLILFFPMVFWILSKRGEIFVTDFLNRYLYRLPFYHFNQIILNQ